MLVPIRGYEKLYKVDSEGKVFSIKSNKYLKAGLAGNGYFTVSLYKNGSAKTHCIHRLLAEHFIDGYFEGAYVNHKDKDRQNNMLNNLEWVTPAENIKHGCSKNYLITHPSGKQEEVFNLAEFCRQYNLHTGCMCYVAKGIVTQHKGFSCRYL